MCSFTCGICLSGLCVCSRKATHTATFRLKGKHTQMKIILPTYANGKDTLFFATCVTDPKETLIFVTKVRAFTVAPVHYSQPPAVKAKARESLPLPFFMFCHWQIIPLAGWSWSVSVAPPYARTFARLPSIRS